MSRIIMLSLQSSSPFFLHLVAGSSLANRPVLISVMQAAESALPLSAIRGHGFAIVGCCFKNFPHHMTLIKPERKKQPGAHRHTHKDVFPTERKDCFKFGDISKQINPIIKNTQRPRRSAIFVFTVERRRKAPKHKRVHIVGQTMEPIIKIKKYRNT